MLLYKCCDNDFPPFLVRLSLLDSVAVSIYHYVGQLETAYAGARGLGKDLFLWKRHFKILMPANYCTVVL